MKPQEEWIAAPKNTVAVLKKYQFTFKKSLGQNFLIDLHVLNKILKAAVIGPGDEVLEIGPGIGSLTQAALEQGAAVTAVEIDETLIPILQENLSEYPHVTLVAADFLKLDLPSFFAQHFTRPVKVLANLPYYITTPILMNLLESRVPLENLTLMVQEEVARRMKAGPGTKDYGALSLAVQYYAQPYIAAYVPQNCFIPRPGVGSAVISLTIRKKPPVEVSDEKLMFSLIRAAFGQRRKTLVNSVSGSPELSRRAGIDVSKEHLLSLLEEQQLPLAVRGETLELSEFAALADGLARDGA